jgi:hypothetical protein
MIIWAIDFGSKRMDISSAPFSLKKTTYDEIVKSKISPPLEGGDNGEGDK